MVNNETDQQCKIENVHRTMLSAKRLKNSAVIPNLVDLKPVRHIETLWYKTILMISLFLRVRENILEARDSLDFIMTVSRSLHFARKLRRYKNIFH